MHDFFGGRARAARLALAAAALVLPLAGCGIIDDIVEVKPRDQIDPGALTTAEGAKALYNGAINNLSIAFSGNNGGTEGIALISGMMADEWFHSGTFNTRESYDRRAETSDNGTVGGVLRNLHDARHAAVRAFDALNATSPTPATDARISEMKAIEGLLYVLGGETFCAGLPFSEVQGSTVVDGPPLTTAEIFNAAIVRLDAALAGAPGTGNNIRNLASILKARALMNLGKGNFTAAAALVASVPTTYVYNAFHSTQGNRNGIFVFNTQNERFSLSHREGGNGLPFRGASTGGTDPAQADPRLPWQRLSNDVGFDNVTPQYDALKWKTFDDEVVIASGKEARLMEAEALLNSGDVAGWLAKHNALRATVPGLAALTDPGTAVARENLHFSERAFWLFGEGHRLGDLRRMIRQYGRTEAAIFPTGTFHKGGSYGADVTFPINDVEENNKAYKAAKTGGQLNIRGCISDGA